MELDQSICDKRNLIKASVGLVVIAVCLFAMFSFPLLSGRGAPALPAAGPSVLTVIIIGFAIGCYGTIVGIGGGPLIMPTLALCYGWQSESLVATCLFIVLLNALSGSVGYGIQKRIDYKAGMKFALAALPGAVVLSFLHHVFDIRFFNVIFGIFLILLAVYSLLSAGMISREEKTGGRAKTAGHRRVRFTDRFGEEFKYYSDDRLGVVMNVFLGFFIGFLGIGGGVFQVPVLLFLLHYPPHIATATSHFITMLTAAFALIPHLFLGNVYFGEAMWMGLGVVGGAQVGARLAPRIKSKVIVYLFVVVLLVFAVKLFI
jgi:uncharacterized membrane protein YfcA